MARYVLLSFDSDAEADEFVEKTQQHGNVLAYNTQDDTQWFTVKVRGVWKKPTLFCDPSDGHRRKKGGWSRGKKWGWWVCSDCGKPSKAWAAGDHWFVALGKNLLPTSEDAPEWRGEGKRGHVWVPNAEGKGGEWQPVPGQETRDFVPGTPQAKEAGLWQRS